MLYDPEDYPEGHSPFCHRSCAHPCHDKYEQEVKKRDEYLKKTEDFLSYCRYRDLNSEDLISLKMFKNYVIDHGGSLEDCG
jgi:hypothetical protein